MSSEAALKQAADWCKMAQWKVQERRQWAYQFGRKTIVRYVVKTALDEMEATLDWLTGANGCEGLTVENKVITGSWKTIAAWYEYGPPDSQGIRRVNLYHAIRPADESGEDGPYLIEDGCRYRVSFTFYWRISKPPAVPASESGISYSLENIRKDDETGTFSCMLVKRERQIQEIPLYTDHKDVYKETATREVQGIREGANHDIDGAIPEAKDGVFHDVDITKDNDCTHATKRKITTEKPVPGAQREVRFGWLTQTVRRTDKHQPPFTIPEVAPKRGKVISYAVEVTPGNLNDVTTTETTELPAEDIRLSCSKTIFQHQDSSTDGGQDQPLGEAPETKDGVIYEYRSELSDNGFYTNTISIKYELPVQEAIIEKRVGYRTSSESVTHVNQPTVTLPVMTATRGKTVSYRVEKTPGGRFNITITVTAEIEADKIRESCGQTLYQHQHTTTAAGATAALGEAPVAKDGVFYEWSSELTEFGTYNTTKREVRELQVLKSHTAASADAFSSMVQKTDTHLKDPGAESVTFTVGTITAIQSERTQGGRNNVTTRTETAGTPWSKYYWFADQQTTHHVFLFDNQTDIPLPDGLKGITPWRFSVSVNRNRFGLYSGQMTWMLYVNADGPDSGVKTWREEGIQEKRTRIITLPGGTRVKATWIFTYNEGVSLWDGTAARKINGGLEGSSFQRFGRRGFHWKKVTKIAYSETKLGAVDSNGMLIAAMEDSALE